LPEDARFVLGQHHQPGRPPQSERAVFCLPAIGHLATSGMPAGKQI
jgi:hypothetical protein